ncbi:MAG: ParB N-terminal domain-containing protein [Clostridia bacterium]|nr:ParB N-terminal domain-containing protein [Clostridia bacterium]
MRQMLKLVSYINPSKIMMPPANDLYTANDYCLEPLKSSITKHGIITPLVIRTNENGYLELVSGKRRLICARLLRLKAVPCVKIKCSKTKAALFRLADRLSVLPAGDFEMADNLSYLINDHPLNLAQIAEYLSVPSATLEDKLRLVSFPFELRGEVDGILTEEQIHSLMMLPRSALKDAIHEVKTRGLGIAATKELVGSYFLPKKKEPVRKTAIGDVRFFVNSVEKMLTTLKNAGYETDFTLNDTDTHVDFSIKIKKKAEPTYSQMKIC